MLLAPKHLNYKERSDLTHMDTGCCFQSLRIECNLSEKDSSLILDCQPKVLKVTFTEHLPITLMGDNQNEKAV